MSATLFALALPKKGDGTPRARKGKGSRPLFWATLFACPGQELLQEFAQPGPVPGIRQGKQTEGLKITLEGADIKAPLLGSQPHAQHLAALVDQGPHGVGELDLASLARGCVGQQLKNRWCKDVT